MTELPYLTKDLPGIGGRLKEAPADFLVEEIPAYQPCGSGEHLFLWVEKEDLSAEELVKRLGRALRLKRNEIGMAGLKDRRAVTRQSLSVPASCEPALKDFDDPQIRLLSAVRHTNKLKTGHLRGNRFTIRIRPPYGNGEASLRQDDPTEILRRAAMIAEELRRRGLPNFYGEQRFGRDGETLALGNALLRGESSPQSIAPARRRFLLRLALSAAQSELFNQALIDRLKRGEFETVLPGDLMQKTDSGGLFVTEDPAADQRRFDSREINITGPVFGPKMKTPAGEAARREIDLLESAGLSGDAFQRFPKLTPGTRRSFRVSLTDLEVSRDPQGVLISVTLPPGSYATVLAREFIKIQ